MATKQGLTRAQAATYQGAFEAVLSVPIGSGLGYWFDRTFETAPVGLAVGTAIGFAALVLRLVRMRPTEQGEDGLAQDHDEDERHDGSTGTKGVNK